jgi:AraC-like DNA-binding protein
MLSTSSESDELLLQGKLLTYISLILEEADSAQKASSYKRRIVMQSQSYIKEHFCEQIKLSDIARDVNLSPNYFHSLFTEVCGMTPHDYLVEHRINIAKNLLITADLSLSDIAERCGFKNQQYLTSVFKSKIGLSPTHFKKEHQSAYFV